MKNIEYGISNAHREAFINHANQKKMLKKQIIKERSSSFILLLSRFSNHLKRI